MPKTPDELKEQIEWEARTRPKDAPADHERTAEGLEVPTPTRDDFFGNLETVAKPD